MPNRFSAGEAEAGSAGEQPAKEYPARLIRPVSTPAVEVDGHSGVFPLVRATCQAFLEGEWRSGHQAAVSPETSYNDLCLEAGRLSL